MKALIVDDSSTLRAFLGRVLTKNGFECVEASTGLEALKIVDHTFGLILLDWNMPQMDGLETLRELRKRSDVNGIPIMMVTTEIDSERILSALDAGATEYLMKPFTPELVAAKLTVLGLKTEAE